MKYEAYIPCDLLKPFIKSFIISESDEAATYKVLPDTGLVIGFQYQGRLFRLEKEKEFPLSTSGITGLGDAFRTFRNLPHTGTVLVLFREGGAAHFFKQPVHELFRESVSLDSFMLRSELLVLEEQLAEATTDAARITVTESFLLGRLRHTQPDQLVQAALHLLHQHKGNIRIGILAAQLCTSQSPLEKRFRQVVGTTPKKFAAIIRMKWALQHYQPQQSLTSLGYEAGFYDQAHFIREFKNFTGQTPEGYFAGR